MSEELDAWFAAAGEREEELRRVDALIMAAAPGIDRQLVPMGSRRMLGYGLMPYKPKSAKVATTWPLIGLAAQKRHLSVYVCAVVDGEYLAEARAERLGKVSCGRSCIRFATSDDVDAVELDRLIRDAVRVTGDGSNGYYADRRSAEASLPQGPGAGT